MTVASLSKLTVPLPAGQSSTSQGLLMPKLKYRFRVTFQSFGVSSPSTELTKQIMTVTRPELSFDPVVIDVYNSRIKLAGKHSWSDVTVVIRDDVSNAVSKLVGEQLQKQVDVFEQASAASGIDYKFTMVIETLDGGNGAFEPTTLDAWELEGCFIQKAVYAQGDYKSSDPQDITLTISFDNAIQTNAAGNPTGVGQNVGRTVRTLSTG